MGNFWWSGALGLQDPNAAGLDKRKRDVFKGSAYVPSCCWPPRPRPTAAACRAATWLARLPCWSAKGDIPEETAARAATAAAAAACAWFAEAACAAWRQWMGGSARARGERGRRALLESGIVVVVGSVHNPEDVRDLFADRRNHERTWIGSGIERLREGAGLDSLGTARVAGACLWAFLPPRSLSAAAVGPRRRPAWVRAPAAAFAARRGCPAVPRRLTAWREGDHRGLRHLPQTDSRSRTLTYSRLTYTELHPER